MVCLSCVSGSWCCTFKKHYAVHSSNYRIPNFELQVYMVYGQYVVLINPRRACVRVTVVVLCVCVSVYPFSLFCLLALLGVQREVSAATARKFSKIKKPFSLKLLSSKVRSVINLPRLSQPFSSRAMFPYTSP